MDSLDRAAVEECLHALSEESKPLWGMMTPQHLIEHFIYVFRMSIGEVEQTIVTPTEKLPAYKNSLHSERRLPKFFPSPYLRKDQLEDLEFDSFSKALDILYSYFDSYEKYYNENPKATHNHVIYGPLDKEHWDLMMKKHFDHHFRQFDLKKHLKGGYVDRSIDKLGIGTIEFFHPAHNSLPSNLLTQLQQSIAAYSVNEKCKVILLKSGGSRTFCAGASFDELKAISTPEAGKAFFSGFANVINAIRTSDKLVIGRVHGKAVGGGVGIAAAVDYCFATKFASVKLSELGIGIGPFVISPALKRKIGLAAFSQLTLDFNRFYDPNWAVQKGLYQQIFETADEMDDHIHTFCQNLVSTNPEARLSLKKLFWESTENWEADMQKYASESGNLVLSEFTKNALKN